MNLTLRHRILLTLVPLLALLAMLGGGGFLLLSRLGERIDEILRENHRSVIYMERLNEAAERIDSALQFALVGREQDARRQYDENWKAFDDNLAKEAGNITLPGEADMVDGLTTLRDEYRRQGDAFFSRPNDPARKEAYFGGEGQTGLLDLFKRIKDVAWEILRINQENMEKASRDARATARSSLLWFGIGLGVAAVLALFWGRHTVRTLLSPIRAVTDSALAIGAGNLDQVVPVPSGDELGLLAGAFNTMARQLRAYRTSQQAQMLRLQKTTQAAIDSFPHPVLVVDPEGRVELANPAARRALGVLNHAIGTGPTLPWIPPEPLQPPLQEALRGQRAYLPEGFDRAFALRAGEEERFFLPRVLPIRDPEGTTLGAAVLLEDVTRFRLLDEVKSNLVATVSHELKTPLTSIRLAVHVLLEEAVGPLSPKQTELLVDARDNTERLLAMINNLLDLARIQQGGRRLDLRPERPAELLQSAAEAVRPRTDDKGIDLVVDAAPVLPEVAADARQLGHALNNLLDNAVRYTERGGRITLSAATEDGDVILTVADTGPGIAPEYLPHVFDRFFRVPGQGPEHGTGLGLAIVHEIVTAHGGEVACVSGPGGTQFRLTLPFWPGDGRSGAERGRSAAAPHS